jgi:mono/diheme cytochrome c family protein
VIRGILFVLAVGVVGYDTYVQAAAQTSAAGVAVPSARQAAVPSEHTALIGRYCATCHNERLRTAALVLDPANLLSVADHSEVWEKVVRKLRTRAMPPVGLPRPDERMYDAFASWLETQLDAAAEVRPNPGRATLHRLNRAEYTNAVRDLLALEIDGRSLLPADDAGYGFDNIADALSVSPLLIERYVGAARRISRLAVGDRTIEPGATIYRVPKYLVQSDRMGDDLPFGSRGGAAIRHRFPLDAEYFIKVRLQRTWQDQVVGLQEPREIEIRLDGAEIRRFTVGRPAGTGRPSGYPTEAEQALDDGLEVRFGAKAGTRVVAATFPKVPSLQEGVLGPRLIITSFAYAGDDLRDPAVDTIEIRGPYAPTGPGDTTSRRAIFICRPASAQDEEPCARKILASLARRAYRRPLAAGDVDALLEFYRRGARESGFEKGIQLAIERLLVSPQFLFRIERDPQIVASASPYRISDVELASRLSFFLWSSIPDDDLLKTATRGRLKDPATLEQQVRRMLADPRSKALVDNFAGQWLYLRNIERVHPDPNIFPEFDDNLREAFQRETELFFSSSLREDRSVIDLLNADYTYLNERLARHYGVEGVYGSHFRRVTLQDADRKGILGHGSVLTATSYATRTSPVLRGKWLLENIVGAPPPPPPPNVPDLKPTINGKKLTMREQMEAHRANAVCASCHARMDPLGFALERFDAVGKMRTHDEGTPIDTSGTLPNGVKFNGPAGLQQALLQDPNQFVTSVTEKVLTYALGRGVEASDAPAVRKIVREAARNGYRWSSILIGIAKSAPFQMRRPAS